MVKVLEKQWYNYLQPPDGQTRNVFSDVNKRRLLVHEGGFLLFDLHPGVTDVYVHMVVGQRAEVRPGCGWSLTAVRFIRLLADKCRTLHQTIRESGGCAGRGITEPVQIRPPCARARPGTCKNVK